MRLRPGRLFGKPLGCALLCACAAWAAHRGLTQLGLGSGASAGAAIGAGGLVYAASLLASRALAKKDLLMLPGGEKLQKRLKNGAGCDMIATVAIKMYAAKPGRNAPEWVRIFWEVARL